MHVKVNNQSKHHLPIYETVGSAGMDVRAHIDAPIELKPLQRALVPTGLFLEIPIGYECQVRPRSGLAAKNAVTVLNSPGTIDSDYRGEIKIILINHGKTPFTVKNGDRIAQAVIASVLGKNVISLNKVSEISDDTQRSSGGFGSTGVN